MVVLKKVRSQPRQKRDDVADEPAPRELKHNPRAHRTADNIDARQASLRDVTLDAADQTIKRPAVGLGRGSPMAGKVDRNDIPRGAEWVQDGAPRSPTPAQAVDQKQRASSAALNRVHAVFAL